MPSKDPINPEANAWLRSDLERPSGIVRAEPGETGSQTGRRAMSAQVLRLARRRNVDPDQLAARIPADTLRRTKYPVIEVVNPDGTRSFKHDLGIEERVTSLVHSPS